MANKDIQLVVEGPGAETAAGELSELILENFEHPAEPVPVGESGGAGTRIDPITVAALVIAIPPSVLAVMDIVERIKKKKKAEKLLEGAENIATTHPGTEIRVRKPDGTLISVRGMDAGTLMDLFTEALK